MTPPIQINIISPSLITNGVRKMKLKYAGTFLSLSLLASTAYALAPQEIASLIHQQQQASSHQLTRVKSAHAAFNWKNLHGPNSGGNISIVAGKQNPLLMFTFSGYGLYKSIDGGLNWVTLPTPKDETIHDLALIDDHHLLLAADNHIYISHDQGDHWILSATKDLIINHIFVLNPNFILMQTNQRLVSGREGIYRSIDGGNSWEPARLGLNDDNGFWTMGGRDNLLFIGANGLYVSTNGGKLWTQPSDKWSFFAWSIAVNSNHDVFAATGNHVYKTDPMGQTLVDVKNGITGSVYNIKLDKNDYLYAVGRDYDKKQDHLYQSIDNGNKWQRLYSYPEIKDFAILDSDKVIMNTNEGLVQSDVHQQNANKLPFPFSLSETKRVFALDDKHYFALDNVLSHSDDAGNTWTVSRDAGTHLIDAIAFNQQILSLEWDKNGNDQHIFSSSDHGKTWQNIYDNILSVDHSSCGKLLHQGSALIVTCEKSALFTRDLVNWTKINKSGGSYYFDDKSMYYANGNSIQRSQDEGKTWMTLLDKLHAYGLKLSGAGNIILVAIPMAGIIKITSDAQDWDLLATGISDFHFTDIVALDEMHYIASTDNGIFYTSNGGKNWQEENQGLSNFEITNIFANQKFILLGTKGSGVFYSPLVLN